jgi:hypothetical protein
MNPPPITSVAARAALVCWLLLATSVLTRADEPSPQPDPGERISHASEIWKLIADQTFYGRYNPNGKSWAEYQSSDGRTAYKENDCIYAGHWSIKDDLVCYRYDAINHGQPACFALFRHGKELDFYMPGSDGKWFLNAYTTDRQPGNPDKMPVDGQSCVGV